MSILACSTDPARLGNLTLSARPIVVFSFVFSAICVIIIAYFLSIIKHWRPKLSDTYIYVIGQPDTKSGIIESIHALGYRAGLLQDSRIDNNYDNLFDTVLRFNFDKIDQELDRIDKGNFAAAGFICTYENYIISHSRISEYFSKPALSLRSAKLCTDKLLMRQAFKDTDPSITPAFSEASSLKQALNFATEFGYPLILKPTGLVKSLLVLKCDNEQQLRENFQYAVSEIKELYRAYNIYDREARLVIEEFLDGKQYSVAAFVDSSGTAHFCDDIVSLTTAQEIGKDDNYLYKRRLPADISQDIERELLRASLAGIKALELTSSPAHIELMLGKGGAKIIEIGARIGGYRPRMYKASYGVDLVEQSVRLAVGKDLQVRGELIKNSAVYELFPDKKGAFDRVSGKIPEDVAYFRQSPKGKSVGPAKNGFKASAIIMINDDNVKRFTETCNQAETMQIVVTT